jgi:predicted dehydrogenase
VNDATSDAYERLVDRLLDSLHFGERWGRHWLDMARMLLNLDLPTSVSGLGRHVVKDAKEWPDTITALHEFPDLTLVWEQRLWTKYGIQGLGGGVEVDGDKGSLTIDRAGWTFYPKSGEPVKHKASDDGAVHTVNFADCIIGKAKPAAPIEEGFRSAVLCHLANITATLNRRVVFDPSKQEIVGDAEAAKFVTRTYRDKWKLPTI